jgi:D-lactate dehydrogenase
MLSGVYLKLYQTLSSCFPPERLLHDDLRTLAFGTDASFYRLVPRLVIKVHTEQELILVLRECRRWKTPVTFRAAGTSLSGQAITDSVMIHLGAEWKGIRIHPGGERVSLQPGVIGAVANYCLLPYQRKIGPDPASINSAMIGGIAANNASGMCCGTAQNSYRTLASMRIILGDGALLDTADARSREKFKSTHAEMVSHLEELSKGVRSNRVLAARIRTKYKMKNTTGYSLNALVDYEDPIDILQHLMIGSEGTLGFIAEITYDTVPELPSKASSLMVFPDLKTACQAAALLKRCPVAAVEIMDRASLRSVENKAGMPCYLKELGALVTALLVETSAENPAQLHWQKDEIVRAMQPLPVVFPLTFTENPAEYTQLWDIRKGLFPSVGAMRRIGTTVIIEDVAFPIDRLAEATLELQRLFAKYGYWEAIIFGHALKGNLHFVFTQDFNDSQEVRRYQKFMDEVTRMVVLTYDGSLKAEHGTGRNMAPFVELEWGAEAYQLMKEIKALFDPDQLLNPGVILNNDPKVHLKNLKPLPQAHPLIDQCIECGFCEAQCPSRDLTLTPRQRIVIWREIVRLQTLRKSAARLAEMKKGFSFQGEQTCATDGLCATSCPVGIDTGQLIKELRMQQKSPMANWIAWIIARNMGATTFLLRAFLNLADFFHGLLGPNSMERLSRLLRAISLGGLPQWNRCVPKGGGLAAMKKSAPASSLHVVYFPSCVSRSMGTAKDNPHQDPQTVRIASLLRKAGCAVIYPPRLTQLCCGMAFASKGYQEQGDMKLQELNRALLQASEQGRFPVLVDTSPCQYRMKESGLLSPQLQIFEPVEFILKHLQERLRFIRKPKTVAVHTTCSSRKMGLESSMRQLAELCAEEVIVPQSVTCCGFAGDRGFSHPELMNSALGRLKEELPAECREGYSTSRTCEIGLSLNGGIPYRSIAYLVDECTVPRQETLKVKE